MARSTGSSEIDCWGGVFALFTVTAAVLTPISRVQRGPILCPFRRLTGLPCPSCGLTRSVVAAAHGRLSTAVRYHPLGPLVLLSLLVGLTAQAGGARPWSRAWKAIDDSRSGTAIVAALLSFGVARAVANLSSRTVEEI